MGKNFWPVSVYLKKKEDINTIIIIMKNWGRIDWGRTGLGRNDSKSSVDCVPPSLHNKSLLCYPLPALVYPRHLGTWTSWYWTYETSRYSVLEISVLNNKNNLIEFKNFLIFLFTCRRCLFRYWIIKIIWLNFFFTCRRCLYKFVCFFFNHL